MTINLHSNIEFSSYFFILHFNHSSAFCLTIPFYIRKDFSYSISRLSLKQSNSFSVLYSERFLLLLLQVVVETVQFLFHNHLALTYISILLVNSNYTRQLHFSSKERSFQCCDFSNLRIAHRRLHACFIENKQICGRLLSPLFFSF